MSKVMSKAEMMAEGKLKTEKVPMGEGKHIVVSELSALHYNDLYKASEGEADDKGVREIEMSKFNPLLLAFCIVDKNGKRIFDNTDGPILAELGNSFSAKIMPVAKKLNGLAGDEGNDSEAINDASSTGE